MDATRYVEFWQPSHWRREYGYYDPQVYTKGYHRAQDIAGGDWGNKPVPALRAGRVVDTGFGVGIGYWVAIQSERNRVDGYCHLYGPGRPAKGTDIPKGGSVSRLAHKNESPGSAWSGEHLHFLITDSASGVPNAKAWDTDPRPVIQAELASLAGGGSTPFDPPNLPEEEDMSQSQFFISYPGLLYHAAGTPGGGVKHVQPGQLDIISGGIQTPGYWKLDNGKTLADGIPTFDTKGNKAALDALLDYYGEAPAPAAQITDAQIKAIADATAAQIKPGVSIDYDKVADTVRERFRADPLK